MPEITPPEGKILVSWINKKKEVVRKGIQLEENDTWNPVFGPEEGEYVTVKFETGTDEKIDDLKILKGTELYLPVKPNNYKDWKFLYWIDKDGYVALAGTKVNEDMTIYAYWWKPSSGGSTEEKVTIKFDTGTKEKFEPIELLKGSKYIFVTPTESNGDKVFRGWLDDKGELLTSESIVEKSMTLKANWKEPYTCPENCTPNSDGKTCVQQTTVDPTKEMICQGTEYRGYCIDTKNISDQDCARQCASGYPFGDTEVDYPVASRYLPEYDMTSSVCCAKKIDRVERNTCPEGYERDGEKCTKTETINCTAN